MREYRENKAAEFEKVADSIPPPPDTAGGAVGKAIAVAAPVVLTLAPMYRPKPSEKKAPANGQPVTKAAAKEAAPTPAASSSATISPAKLAKSPKGPGKGRGIIVFLPTGAGGAGGFVRLPKGGSQKGASKQHTVAKSAVSAGAPATAAGSTTKATSPQSARSGNVQKPVVADKGLKNLVEALYKGANTQAPIGTGSTADAIRTERDTGLPVGGKWHTTKGSEMSRALEKWLLNNPSAPAGDRAAAAAMKADLDNALKGK